MRVGRGPRVQPRSTAAAPTRGDPRFRGALSANPPRNCGSPRQCARRGRCRARNAGLLLPRLQPAGRCRACNAGRARAAPPTRSTAAAPTRGDPRLRGALGAKSPSELRISSAMRTAWALPSLSTRVSCCRASRPPPRLQPAGRCRACNAGRARAAPPTPVGRCRASARRSAIPRSSGRRIRPRNRRSPRQCARARRPADTPKTLRRRGEGPAQQPA